MSEQFLTAEQRADMYRRIFDSIPRTFLDPSHEDNQLIIGAMAYAVAYTEAHWLEIEREQFLDTATMAGLKRFGTWFGVPVDHGEGEEDYRQRLQQALYGPRQTIHAIERVIGEATGLKVRVHEVGRDIVTMNRGAWTGKKLLGERYCWAVFEVITEGQTTKVPKFMDRIRAAGTRWRHIELVYHSILHDLAPGGVISRERTKHWALEFPEIPFPLFPATANREHLAARGGHWGRDFTKHSYSHVGRAALIRPMEGEETEHQTLAYYLPADAPLFAWNDSASLWDESRWAN